MIKIKNKKSFAVISSIIVVIVAAVLLFIFADDLMASYYENYVAPVPAIVTHKNLKADDKVVDGDFYVSTKGDDSNPGTKDAPFLTVERAVEAVRNTDKTNKNGIIVCIEAGDYHISSLEFTKEDSGTARCPVTYRAFGGEVVFNGGMTLDPSAFSPVTDFSVKERLSDDAKENVICTDLTKLGLSADDWGKIYPVGKYGTQDHYDGDTTGPSPCQLYFNGTPLTTARYPDEGFLKTVDIIREGEGRESSTSNHTKREDWDELRNPETTIFTVDGDTAERINAYSSLEDVWLWTALIYNWADTTVPLKSFNYESKAVEPAYVSLFGAVPDSTYYVFNVLEELDSPNEWYLDRDTGMLYFYPSEQVENAEIILSLSTEEIISVNGAEYLNFEGLSVRGTRGNGIAIKGNNIKIENCLVSELSGVGVSVDGYRNKISKCEFAHIGAAAVDITGGNRETLEAGENLVENCLIHDFSEVAVTAGPGVNLGGVGNICSHNEFYNSPQQAIIYGGNNLIIEYNLMHDVALLSDDSSVIYTGRRWDQAGSVLRYNVMYNMGDDDHHPNGIYWDDGASGQTAYGNVVVNCKGNGFLIGGGRNNDVYNNILINCNQPFFYDQRSRNAVLDSEFWFEHSREGLDMHCNLLESPWQSAAWQKAYPYMAKWSLDYSDTDNPDFIPNPSESNVNGNLIIHYAENLGIIEESVFAYSNVSGNAVYKIKDMKNIFVDFENGDYRLCEDSKVLKDIPGFEAIAFEEAGIK